MDIVVAEDDIVSAKLILKNLADLGHKPFLAEDGLMAWEVLQTNDIRMVIADWMMPRMDGAALCRKVREASLPHYVYFILMTSNDRKDNVVPGLNAGADDYILKPFDPKELAARIRSGQRIIQLEEKYQKAHIQLLQSEKMASIGQLAAGVAHEINNPTGFVSSNLKSLTDYQTNLIQLIQEYREIISQLENTEAVGTFPESIFDQVKKIKEREAKTDIDYVLNDIPNLIRESRDGLERIKKIVLDLKGFAHPGQNKAIQTDINKNLDSTLNVVWNEIKYKATVTKDYGVLPEVACYPQQLNQVFMNLLVNAAQAMEKNGCITITTRAHDGYVEIKISDTGMGIPKQNLSKIFDPFFTTKDIGKGTGLGLTVAYDIINKHNGNITVESTEGVGTTFSIQIPALKDS
jgi:signal transduction histidine kinase